MDPSQPSTAIQKASGGTKGGGGEVSCGGTGQVFATVPMASCVYPVGTDNNGYGAVHGGSGTDSGHIYTQGAGFSFCSGYTYATASKNDDTQDLLGDGLGGNTGASQLSIIGGVLRLGELSPSNMLGYVPHALQMICQTRDMYASTVASDEWRWPALTADNKGISPTNGYTGTNPLLVMGALLALKPTFNLGSLTTQPAKMLATTLMYFGGYICNTIGGANAITVEVAPPGTGTSGDERVAFQTDWAGYTGMTANGLYFDQAHNTGSAWANDCITIWAALQIVKVPSGDTAWGPGASTSYGRVLSNYTGTPVGAGWDGATGSGAPLTAFPPNLGTSGSGGITVVASGSPAVTEWGAIGTGAGAATLPLPAHQVTVGNTVIFSVNAAAPAAPTVNTPTDSLGNTWHLASSEPLVAGTLRTELWYANITTGGSMVITAAPTGGTGTYGITATAWEFNGILTPSPVDQTINATNTGTALATGITAATGHSLELVFVAAAVKSGTQSITVPAFNPSTTMTTGDFWQLTGADNNGLQTFWEISGTTGTQSFTGTLTGGVNWNAILATFQAASATTGPPPGAPTDLVVRATGTTGQHHVVFALPTVVGDGITSTVLSYYASPFTSVTGTSTITGTGTNKTVTIAGMDGSQYMWSAHCVNDAGAGPETSLPGPVSVSVTSSTAPSAPIAPNIDSIGPSDAVCDWGPQPPVQGTAFITSYALTITVLNSGSTVATFTVNDQGGPDNTPSLSFDATGLPIGLLGAAVTATNSVGTSSSSAVTPFTIASPSDDTHQYFVSAFPSNPLPSALAPQVLIGFQANPSYSGAFVLGTSVLGGTDTLESFVMTDVSQYLTQTISSARGRSRETDSYSAGQLTLILRNENRYFDPTNTASPYYPGIIPRAPVQVNIAGQRVFTGYANDFLVNYTLDSTSTVSVPCTDGFGLLAMTTLNSFQAQLETSGQRIADVLDRDEIAYPGPTNVATGVVSLQASTQDQIAALDHCQTAAQSEGGLLYCDRFNVLQFKDQTYIAQIYPIWPNGILQLSDNATDIANGAIGYTDIQMLSASTLLFNQVQGTRTGGVTQQIDYVPSEDKYLIRCLTLPSLECVDDPTVLALCNLYLLRYAFPEVRFDTITVDLLPLAPSQRAAVAALDLGNAIQITRTPPGGGSAIIQLCMIEAVNWSADASTPSYKITFSLMNISGQVYFILGSSTQGILASNKIF